MSGDRRKEDDIGELFQVFQVLVAASGSDEDDNESTNPEDPQQGEGGVPNALPRFSIDASPHPRNSCVRADFLRHAQRDFHLPLKIDDDIADDERIPFLAFVSLLRGEVLSMHSLSFFRISTPMSDDDSGGAGGLGRPTGLSIAHGSTPQHRLEDSLRRRTLAMSELGGGGSQMDSVRSGRKKTLLQLSHRAAGNGDDSRDLAHRAFLLLERLYGLLATEIEILSSEVVVPPTSWTERHPRDPKDPPSQADRSIAKKVFPVQFRKKRYTLAEVEQLISDYEAKNMSSCWGSKLNHDPKQQQHGTAPGGSSSPSAVSRSSSKTGDNVKFIGGSPLPKLDNAFISKSADDAEWSKQRRRSKRISSLASESSDVDSTTPQKHTRHSLPNIAHGWSPSVRPSVVGFVEDEVQGIRGDECSSPDGPTSTTGIFSGDYQLPQASPESRRAYSLPPLRGSPSPSLSHCHDRGGGGQGAGSPKSESKLAEIYHQRYPKIPANFKRKYHSELSDRLYKHVPATTFDKLTLSKPYVMPVDQKLELRERYKSKGATMCREDLLRNGFCYSSIPWIAAKALEGLDQAVVARSLSTEL